MKVRLLVNSMNISNLLSNAGLSGNRPDGPGSAGVAQTNAAQYSNSASATGSDSASSGDQVSLSGVSQLLNSGSVQRTAALASLTSAVRSGSYNVSGADIGRSMVSEMLARSSGY